MPRDLIFELTLLVIFAVCFLAVSIHLHRLERELSRSIRDSAQRLQDLGTRLDDLTHRVRVDASRIRDRLHLLEQEIGTTTYGEEGP